MEFSIAIKKTFSDQEILAREKDCVLRAQIKLDAQILADSNYYCPMKQSVLQKSAIIGTVLGSGRIRWITPYARRQYFGVNFDHSKSANPNACAKWFEAAKARKLPEWLKLVKEELKK